MQVWMDKHLHIISFDVPWPADYGGVIDVFYKVKALHAIGVKVHLHCFTYGRSSQDEIKTICEKVYYYPRNMNRSLLIHPLPFIVVSRQHDALLRHLKQDEHPILFEGLHSCYYLDHPDLKERDKFVRTHNVEHDYYHALADGESGYLKRLYLNREARKLRGFERQLALAKGLFAISPMDQEHFKQINDEVTWLPPFHANETLAEPREKESFALYHGNLSVSENEKAAKFLMDEVFKGLDKKLIIFGNGASRKLRKKASLMTNVELMEGDGTLLMDLVQKAQVNILPTFQATGMKLKLLFSLFNGGHVLVNPPMVDKTGLESCCEIVEDGPQMQAALERLWRKTFSEQDRMKRKDILEQNFSNTENAHKLSRAIFG